MNALEGVRVIDLTMSVAGPFATQILGDLGADVIKIERPEVGDDTRRWGPPFWQGESATFLGLNRNKRSIALDLKDADDLQVVRDLASTADVLVQNLRPGSLAKLGLGYEALSRLNPRLIHCDITGYGVGGPKDMMPAYDPLMQAYSGLMSLTGEAGGAPVRIPASILDQGTGMWVVIGVLAALRERERTGRGTHLNTSLLNTAIMWLPGQFVGYFADGTVPRRLGSGTVGIYPYGAFPTADKHVIIAAGNENLWQRLCAAMDRQDLLDDSRFALNPDRVSHREELFGELSQTLTTRECSYWLERLSSVGVPVTPVQTIDQVARDEQVRSIGAFAHVAHPRIDGLQLVNTPIQFDGRYPSVRLVPPLLGESNDEIRAEVDKRKGAA